MNRARRHRPPPTVRSVARVQTPPGRWVAASALRAPSTGPSCSSAAMCRDRPARDPAPRVSGVTLRRRHSKVDVNAGLDGTVDLGSGWDRPNRGGAHRTRTCCGGQAASRCGNRCGEPVDPTVSLDVAVGKNECDSGAPRPVETKSKIDERVVSERMIFRW